MGLPDGRKSFKIDLAVLMQYRRVTDRDPAIQPASHVAVAYTAHVLGLLLLWFCRIAMC